MRVSWPVLFLCWFIISCNDCDDCGPISNEPTFTLKLFNIDSVAMLQDSIDKNDTTKLIIDTLLMDISGLINHYQDSLDALDTLEGDFSMDSLRFQSKIDSLTREDSLFTSESDALDTVNMSLNIVTSELLSGLFPLDQVVNAESGSTKPFEEVQTDYQIPLNMNADVSNYDLFFNNRVFNLQIGYDRLQLLDQVSRVRIIAENISIISFDPKIDSISDPPICGSSDCSSENEVTIEIYF
ncbi:MAG TPA: hypothetical protein ACFCUD_12840 [Cyclobacteriaceae bacterium]